MRAVITQVCPVCYECKQTMVNANGLIENKTFVCVGRTKWMEHPERIAIQLPIFVLPEENS